MMKMGYLLFLPLFAAASSVAKEIKPNWDVDKWALVEMTIKVPSVDRYGKSWDAKGPFDPNGYPDILIYTNTPGSERINVSEPRKVPIATVFLTMDCKDKILCRDSVLVNSDKFTVYIKNLNMGYGNYEDDASLTVTNLNNEHDVYEEMTSISCKLSDGHCKKSGYELSNFKVVGTTTNNSF